MFINYSGSRHTNQKQQTAIKTQIIGSQSQIRWASASTRSTGTRCWALHRTDRETLIHRMADLARKKTKQQRIQKTTLLQHSFLLAARASAILLIAILPLGPFRHRKRRWGAWTNYAPLCWSSRHTRASCLLLTCDTWNWWAWTGSWMRGDKTPLYQRVHCSFWSKKPHPDVGTCVSFAVSTTMTEGFTSGG